jgi:RNA polymerase sigma factor (sigma-70 family)
MTARHGEARPPDSDRSTRVAILFDRCRDTLRSLALSVLGAEGDGGTAEGVLQDAWLKVARADYDLPDDDEVALRLIYKVVKGVARNRRRYEALRSGKPVERVDEEGRARSPEEAIIARLTVGRVLETRTQAEREVVELRDLEGWTVVEIARGRGCARNTVRELLRRGRQRLRDRLRSGVSAPCHASRRIDGTGGKQSRSPLRVDEDMSR